MYITREELKTAMYAYQIDQITNGDDSIIDTAIATAIDEVMSYLLPNNRKEWLDGRPRYDVASIFAKTGTQRNALLMEHTKVVAEWWIVKLCNADIIYDHVKERYDRSVSYLKMVASGNVTLSGVDMINETTNPVTTPVFVGGSRPKFNHEF